jgi:hypothetical protein
MLTLATYSRRAVSVRDRYYGDAERLTCSALYAAGALRSPYRRHDGRGLVLLIDTSDAVMARAILDSLPTIEMGACGHSTLEVETEAQGYLVTRGSGDRAHDASAPPRLYSGARTG